MKTRRYFEFFFLCFLLLSIFCFLPENRDEVKYLSYQLDVKRTENNGIERIDYVNSEGEIVNASDTGYATVIISRREDQRLEKYYDYKGKETQIYLGCNAILKKFNTMGKIEKITYLDYENKPIIISDGFAMETWEYDENQQLHRIKYFDTEGVPICSVSSGYGLVYLYGEKNNEIRTTFIDAVGNPMRTSQGYASVVHQSFSLEESENSKGETDFYYDENGAPISLSLGQYGVYTEHDETGRASLWTFLDEKGNPIVTKRGYTTVKNIYNDNVVIEQYYNLQGDPVPIGEGQYGVKKENGNVVFLDRNGQEKFILANFLYGRLYLVVVFVLAFLPAVSMLGKKTIIFVLLLYMIAIFYFTLLFRTETIDLKHKLLWNYKQVFSNSAVGADAIKNIWLFVPLGAIMYRLYPRRIAVLIPVALSAFIEGFQFFSGKGLCELDDLICNSWGGWIGFYAEKKLIQIKPSFIKCKEQQIV